MAAKKRPTKKNVPTNRPTNSQNMRLQKALALGGLGSRRDCELLITEGRVDVDGEIVTKLGSSVNPYDQTVRVDGQKLKLPKYKYFMVNKPTGVISTAEDPAGRLRVIDLIPSDQRVFNVGRLDKSSEGLILVTNDGDLANRLTHPKYGVYKTYQVQVAGSPHIDELKPLKKGVRLAEGFAKVADIRIKRKQKNTTDLVIVLDEGRNREIRRLLAAVEHKVLRLKRIAIGNLKLGDLPTGAYRELTSKEVAQLRKVATERGDRTASKPGTSKTKSVGPKSNRADSRTSKKRPGKFKTKAHDSKAKSSRPTKTRSSKTNTSKTQNQKTQKPKSKRDKGRRK